MSKKTVIATISLLAIAVNLVSGPACADQVIVDDLIVEGSTCVGFDCVNNESFGFETIKLKEHNLRIKFEDTSLSAGFPTTDWQIIINDSVDGGRNYFGVDNVTSGKPVLRIFDGTNGEVIIGEGSTDGGAGTMSVGSSTSTRRIVNVADGVAASDAATVGQLNGAITELQTDIDANGTEINSLKDAGRGMSWTPGSTTIGASATGSGSTALGDGASARSRDTALGYRATVTADGSVAVGANSTVNSINSVAVGADTMVEAGADGGSALGQGARVATGATGSVALGQNSVASEANTVSVGSVGNERRLTNIADGINDTDAANVGQLRQAAAAMQADVSDLQNRVGKVERRLDDVGALSSAFSALVPNARSAGNTQIALGTGYYEGSTAMAAGLFHYVSKNVLVNAGVSTTFNSHSTAGRAGVTFGW